MPPEEPALYRVDTMAEAEADLEAIAFRITLDYDAETALEYVRRLREEILGLDLFPQRGTRQLQGPPEVRSVPSHDRRYLINFTIDEVEKVVTVYYVSGGGKLPRLDRLPKGG